MKILLLLFLVALTPISAQYFEFDKVPVPDSKHILSLYRYFAYTRNDPPPLSINGLPIGLPTFSSINSPNSINSQNSQNSANSDSSAPTDANSTGPLRFLAFQFSPSSITREVGSQTNRQLQEAGSGFLPSYLSANPARAAAGLSDSRPAKVGESPTETTQIVFDKLRFVDASGNPTPGSSAGVQTTIISFDDFWNVFFPKSLDATKRFCCNDDDKAANLCDVVDTLIKPAGVSVFESAIVGTAPESQTSLVVPTTDTFLLLFSNCGPSVDLSVSGSIYLKNYYGYLPGMDVPKVSLYLILTAAYCGLLAVWGFLAFKHRAQLIHIHGALAAVLGLGITEALIWFAFYRNWNWAQKRSDGFLGMAIIVSVLKNIFSFMLVLAASLGWGITKPQLGTTTKRKIALLIVAYVLFDSARQIMTQFRLSHELSFVLVIACILPVSILHGVIFFWIFSSIANLMEELQEKGQEQKLKLFQQFWMVLMITMVAAIFFLCAQVFMLSREAPGHWRQEWISSDVAPHLFFIAVLLAMMILWAPSRNSKAMAYSSEIPSDDPMDNRAFSSAVVGRELGRELQYKDTAGPEEAKIADDEYTRIEMVEANAEKQVWGKQRATMKDLDYDDDE